MLVQIRKSNAGKDQKLRLIHNEDYNETIEEKFAELIKYAKEKGWELYDLDFSLRRGEFPESEYLHIDLSTMFNKNIAKFDGEEVSE